jgi:two-component system, cell cycle sensor histidine kinase and response regulator CckA
MAETLILVVEDEGIVGLDIQRRLQNMGYRVPEVVATGGAAVQRALDLRPQLVLMDIRLKGDMDGITAADHIHRLLDVPVIFLTAYADEDTLRRAKVTEPHGYVLKPFEERELHIAVEMALYKHQMDRKLKDSERWLATTLNSITDAIITTDAQGRVNLLNPMAAALTGWTPAEALGRLLSEVFQVVDEETRIPNPMSMANALHKSAISLLEPVGLLLTRAGDELPVQYLPAPIRDSHDQVLGMVLVFRNIAEQRKVQRELLRVQKLESLGLMAGGVAHDFNNLLSALVNNVALLKMRLRPEDELYRRLELVEKALWRGTELTQQLLTFAKGGAPVRKPTDVGGLLRETAELVFAGSNITPQFQFAPDLWLADIDVGQMGHALHNLLINAKEAMPAGGVIELRCENLRARSEQLPALQPGNYVKISLIDCGMGIAPENLGRIFDPYFTTKPHGSGLGLATVHSIIKRHEGHIAVESSLGAGASFAIYLPAAEQGQPGPDLWPGLALRAGKGHVLIMDDEELLRDATGALLEHLGYSYETAKDGSEALELYRTALQNGQPFDAVILDLTVPGGMGGQESLVHLRALDPEVKAIVSSGYFHDPIVANYRAHGFSGVVSKPYTIEEMSETLHRLIQLDSGEKST